MRVSVVATPVSSGAVTKASSTGDKNNMTLFIILGACAAAGICAGIVFSRKKRGER